MAMSQVREREREKEREREREKTYTIESRHLIMLDTVAAGPIGRNAEASGSANFKHIAAIYSYSKTRGLFAGVSLEGSVVVSRGDANEKLYGQRVTAKQLLTGAIPPPPEADALYRALNAKFHTLGEQTYSARSMTSEDGSPRSIGRSSGTFKSAHISAPGTLRQPPPVRQTGGYGAPMAIQQQPYNPTPSSPPSYQPPAGNTYNNSYGQDIKPPVNNHYNTSYNSTSNNNNTNFASQAAAKRAPPPPPPSRKPVMAPSEPTARALYAFDGQQQGDLSFQEGDVITIVQKTDSQDDWWTGKINGRQGIVSRCVHIGKKGGNTNRDLNFVVPSKLCSITVENIIFSLYNKLLDISAQHFNIVMFF